MNANIYLEAQIWGSVLDAKVYIEEKELTVWFPHPTKPNVKMRNLENFPIDGDIDIKVQTWGKRGSHLLLVVKVDEMPVTTIKCINTDGQGEESVRIPKANLV